MWNNTDEPIAYLITFRTYGTWLHGDARGSIDREHNAYGEPFLLPDAQRNEFIRNNLRSSPFILNAKARLVVKLAVIEVCDHYEWHLNAINVRTNHSHSVVRCTEPSSRKALRQFKAFATRRLKEAGLWGYDHSPWAEKGSRRMIWNEQGLAKAMEYVINGQGGPLPDLGS